MASKWNGKIKESVSVKSALILIINVGLVGKFGDIFGKRWLRNRMYGT